MAVTTVYSEQNDCFVRCVGGASYAAARTGTGTLTQLTGATLDAGQLYSSVGDVYSCRETFLNFDTSWLDPTPALGVTFSMYCSTAQPFECQVVSTTTSVPPYDTTSFVSGDALGVPRATLPSPTRNVYNDFDDISMVLGINGSGLTALIVFGANQRDNIPPTANDEFSQFSSAETAGTSQDPRILIYTSDDPAEQTGEYAVRHPPIRDA